MAFLCIRRGMKNQEGANPMEPLQLAVCDGLPQERENRICLLKRAPISTVCALSGRGEALLKAFSPGKFDLLLIDIYMSGMTGAGTVQKIRETDERVLIAFPPPAQNTPRRVAGFWCKNT